MSTGESHRVICSLCVPLRSKYADSSFREGFLRGPLRISAVSVVTLISPQSALSCAEGRREEILVAALLRGVAKNELGKSMSRREERAGFNSRPRHQQHNVNALFN
jgi:hypothetical protein